MELPGIVVQGATLETPPRPRQRPSSTQAVSAPASTSSAEAVADVAATASDDVEGVPLQTLGTAVTVVTRQDLQQQQIRHAADALRSLPGVTVSRTGSPAGVTQVRIRGGEGNHTLVLIDGIEANAPSEGEFDFSNLMAEDIERIEVIRGPQSALYGSNAVSGVVNIITRSGKGPPRMTARVEAGSFNTKEMAASASAGTERVWGTVSMQHQRSDGYNLAPDGPFGEDDGWRFTSLAARMGAMLTKDIQLDFTIRHTDKKADRDDDMGARNGYTIQSDTPSWFETKTLLMGAQLRWDMLDGALTHVFKANRSVTENFDMALGWGFPAPYDNTSEANRFAYQGTYRFATPFGVNHSITGLIDHGRESFDVSSNYGSSSASRNQTGIAAEWRGDVYDTVFLSAGIRHDDNNTFEDFTTWRTGISVPIKSLGIRPHASAGTGVKAPTLFEQFGTTGEFVSNPNLVPEESKGWDAGVEFTFLAGRAIVDVTYFSTDLKNKIDTIYVACPVTPFGCATPINLPGTSQRDGVEVSGQFQITSTLTLGLSYTYLDAVDNTGAQEIRRPPHAGRADLTYRFHEGKGTVRLTALYNGEMDDYAFGAAPLYLNGIVGLDDYWLVSAAASYKINPGLEVYGRVENLFDEKYEEVYGFNTAGAAVYAGLRWTFDADRPGAGLAMK
jgi:vitamin B12 transporter